MALNSSTVDDFGIEKDSPTEHSLNLDLPPTPHPDGGQEVALGHQGVQGTGGIDVNLRVLYCSNVDLSLDYQELFMVMKRYGTVERIRLMLATKHDSYNCFVTFSSSNSAEIACSSLNGHSINDSTLKTNLFSIRNLKEDPYDYVPKDLDKSNPKKMRETPKLTWYVATYKEGRENLIKASECIQSKVGKIPYQNLKRYGKSILIQAGNDTQAVLLSNFKSPENGNVRNITPHKTFNTKKGIIYSKDLYDFS